MQSNLSKLRRSLVAGVGENDVPCLTSSGYRKRTPSYRVWVAMLSRCYNTKEQKAKPTYVGCTVDVRWHKLSGFLTWFKENYREGMALDKDIYVPGNKVYGPEFCVFVLPEVNTIVGIPGRKLESLLPIGVFERDGWYRAHCSPAKWSRDSQYLGRYPTIKEAHKKWQEAKLKALQALQIEQTDPRVIIGLQIRIDWLKEAIGNDLETVSLNCKGVNYADSNGSSTGERRSTTQATTGTHVELAQGPSGQDLQPDGESLSPD